MRQVDRLKTLVLDTEKGICELNGVDISKNTSELHLDFENGTWTLATIQKMMHIASEKDAME